MAKDAIGMMPNGEIEQYPPGTISIPSKPIRVVSEDGTEELMHLDDPFLENDDDLELEDDE